MADPALTVCLCLEDPDQCDVIVMQIASGHAFGPEQSFHLRLQGENLELLEQLAIDIQDCAFPLIRSVSFNTPSMDKHWCPPDVIMVILSPRVHVDDQLTSSVQNLYTLANFMDGVGQLLTAWSLEDPKILIAGDMSLTGASLLAHKVKGLSPYQLVAIPTPEARRRRPKAISCASQYGLASTICNTVTQWWTAAKTQASKLNLGIQFLDTAKRPQATTGYFFSAPVDMTEPTHFRLDISTPIDAQEVAWVKDQTERALDLLDSRDGGGVEERSWMLCSSL